VSGAKGLLSAPAHDGAVSSSFEENATGSAACDVVLNIARTTAGNRRQKRAPFRASTLRHSVDRSVGLPHLWGFFVGTAKVRPVGSEDGRRAEGSAAPEIASRRLSCRATLSDRNARTAAGIRFFGPAVMALAGGLFSLSAGACTCEIFTAPAAKGEGDWRSSGRPAEYIFTVSSRGIYHCHVMMPGYLNATAGNDRAHCVRTPTLQPSCDSSDAPRRDGTRFLDHLSLSLSLSLSHTHTHTYPKLGISHLVRDPWPRCLLPCSPAPTCHWPSPSAHLRRPWAPRAPCPFCSSRTVRRRARRPPRRLSGPRWR
jgi:hypothetical protein